MFVIKVVRHSPVVTKLMSQNLQSQFSVDNLIILLISISTLEEVPTELETDVMLTRDPTLAEQTTFM